MNTQQLSPATGKLLRPALVIVLIAAVLIVGGMAYIWFSGGSGQPSGKTTAPALVPQSGDTRTLFHFTPEESEVRFIVGETLLGRPKNVVGRTNEVAGELLVDFETPANSQIGTIRVNVRTLKTDNEFRNRALRGQILQADQADFEFAEFTPSALLGLPDTITMGEPFALQISGSLTIHGVTREVTFDVRLTPVSESRIEGSAQVTVRHQDFGMTIPEAPGVANVTDEVRLEIDFVALSENE